MKLVEGMFILGVNSLTLKLNSATHGPYFRWGRDLFFSSNMAVFESHTTVTKVFFKNNMSKTIII